MPHRGPVLLRTKRPLPETLHHLAAPVTPLADANTTRKLVLQNHVIQRTRGDAEFSANIGLFQAGRDRGVSHNVIKSG